MTMGRLSQKPNWWQSHSRFHYPDQAAITADHLVFKMKEEVAKNPLAPVGMNSQVNVLSYFCFTQVRPETRFSEKSSMRKFMMNVSSCRSSSSCGEHSYNLQELSHQLQSITGGSKLLCLDSQNLPPEWREMNLNELFETPAGDDVGSAEV